jgi:hypothetical protein
MKSILKLPSAWIPIAMSLAVLATFFTGIALYGVPVREADEGTAAHLFQIWLLLEVLMVAFFAIKWLPRRPMHAPTVLAIQIIAVLAACAPVYFLNL